MQIARSVSDGEVTKSCSSRDGDFKATRSMPAGRINHLTRVPSTPLSANTPRRVAQQVVGFLLTESTDEHEPAETRSSSLFKRVLSRLPMICAVFIVI